MSEFSSLGGEAGSELEGGMNSLNGAGWRCPWWMQVRTFVKRVTITHVLDRGATYLGISLPPSPLHSATEDW